MKHYKRGLPIAAFLGIALISSPVYAAGWNNTGTQYTSTSLAPSTTWQIGGAFTNTIAQTTPGFSSSSQKSGQYTYNSCAASGEVVAYLGNNTSGCVQSCPAGEYQIGGDGVCQGHPGCTGTAAQCAGTHQQWTFSACQNGSQLEYTWNPTTGALLNTQTVSCVAPSSSAQPTNTATTTSCTAPAPTSSSSPAGSSFSPTGCAGSCTSSGCTSTGVETGITTAYTRHCTTSYSCPGPTAQTSCSTSSYSYSSTQSSSTQCQQTEVYLDHCMPNEPGYREAEYCLTFNGSTTNCSAPFGVYDPTNCPVPVGIGSGS